MFMRWMNSLLIHSIVSRLAFVSMLSIVIAILPQLFSLAECKRGISEIGNEGTHSYQVFVLLRLLDA